jgi:hypothetical protein
LNTNQSQPSAGDSSNQPGSGPAKMSNDQNGSGSSNNSSATVANNDQTNQTNSANLSNQLNQSSITGKNDASKNVGNTSLASGNANVSGTVINGINTNLDNVKISEFNVVDKHVGDLVLNFDANCIRNCNPGNAAVNSNNGAGSNNDAAINQTDSKSTFQQNDANVGNGMVLTADSGHNIADKNTGGNTNIQTGNANVSANSLILANNNLQDGQILYGVVNIYGDLKGDIVLPKEVASTNGVQAANIGNGAESSNSAQINNSQNNLTNQTNQAVINNQIEMDSSTGNNISDKNTDGNTNIQTGNNNAQAQVLNVANTNSDGQPIWLVLINQAGNWIGKILGAPAGANYAGSEGTGFHVAENGDITAVNSGNGANSDNNTVVNNSDNNSTTQSNNAVIDNNLKLTANTGGNTASKNTGGESSIQTGNANIIANLVNFVNNNITNGGKLIVTVVNVFGSWIGDFVAPGQVQEKHQADSASVSTPLAVNSEAGIGGPEPSPTPVTDIYPESDQYYYLPLDYQPVTTLYRKNSNHVSKTYQTSVPIESSPKVEVEHIDKNIEQQSSIASPSAKPKKVVKINLAWLLSLIPMTMGYIATRRWLA